MARGYREAAQRAEDAQDAAAAGELKLALRLWEEVLASLRLLPPRLERDTLLALAHLETYLLLRHFGKASAPWHLQRGVSYARTTRDPRARALAQQCLDEALREGRAMLRP